MFEFTFAKINLLRRAIEPIAAMADRANISYSAESLMLQTANRNGTLIALLLVESASVAGTLTCNQEEGGLIGINPKILYDNLDFHLLAEWQVISNEDNHIYNVDNWSISINGDDDQILRFHFRGPIPGTNVSAEMAMLDEAPYARLDLEHDIKAIVGINSSDFRHKLLLLSTYGGFVNVDITDKQLKLFTWSTEFVFTKENDECVIGGVAENDPVIQFSFGLEQMLQILKASLLTRIVWILTPMHPGAPFVINCPVHSLGSIMFLFH